MPAASPSSSSPRPGSSPILWLPIEVFSRILRHLDTPLDLYKASLVDHKWRAAATDARLWQPHYWAFYRVQLIVNTKADQLLLDRRTTNRRDAMRLFLKTCAQSAPPSAPDPLAPTCSPSSELLLYEPLQKGMLMLHSMHGFNEDPSRIAKRLNEVVVELYGDKGPEDKDEATNRIIAQLVKKAGKLPTTEDLEYAERAYQDQCLSHGPTAIAVNDQTPSYPPFLVCKQSDRRNTKTLPDFYTLFVKRLNSDERLLDNLRAHIARNAGILDDVFTLLERYGDTARDLLIALSAGQQLTPKSIAVFAEPAGMNEASSDWPRALDVHARAATGRPQLHSDHCMALQYTAQKLLGHLQRREAIRSMRQLRTRFSSPPAKRQTLKERALQCCLGVEEAMEDVSLFHFSERAEIREYLALLSLYVWKDLQAGARSEEKGPIPLEMFPSGSTRLFLAHIEHSLRRLGFGAATDPDVASELDNCYLNTSLLCPAQRVTSPLMTCVILCAVARRLGVAAAPVHTTSPGAMIIVIEEGERPKDWGRDPSDWPCFYWMPIGLGRSQLYEASEVRQKRASLGLTPRRTSPAQAAKDLRRLMEPASPLDIILRLSEEMQRAVELSSKKPFQAAEPDSYDRLERHHVPSALSMSTNPSAQVRLLRDYLSGRSSTIPWPLPPHILPSSLSLLPPTKAGFPRINPFDLRKETVYCARWITRIFDTHKPFKDSDNALSTAVASRGDFYCDAALMMENHGLNVQMELDLARRAVREGRADYHGRGCADEVQRAARRYIAGVLESDPRKGVAGHGGASGKERVHELLDPAHARNKAVEHRIGTLFTHKVDGYRGVVYGWDRVFRTPSVNIYDADRVVVEPSPASARKQPHYYAHSEDGSRRYVAQCNIEEARAPSGASSEETAAYLRQFLPLITMRSVAAKFETVHVEPWEGKDGSGVKKGSCSSGGARGGGGEMGSGTGSGKVTMVLTPWMRSIWPFG